MGIILYRTSLKILLVMMALFSSMSMFAKQDVEFFIYFDKPPFIIDKVKQIGLSYEFMSALNEYSEKYNYTVTLVPKKRAIYFSQAHSGVLWTNPLWVDDPDMVKYTWIKDLILERELYITNAPHLTYEGIESLSGKILVGVRGYTYFNLEQAFENKTITRIDVHNEKVIPLMLLSNRADVGVVGLQTYEYLKRTIPEIKDKLHILAGYKKEFYRSILIDKSQPELKQDIENWMHSERGFAKWQALKEKWLYYVQDMP